MIKRRNPLYSDLLDNWLSEYRLGVMESTAYNYQKVLPYIKEYFRGVRIKSISSKMIYDFVHSFEILPASSRTYTNVMQLSLKYAVRCGYIHYNPANDVVMPKRTRAEVHPFSEDEIPLLLAANGPDWLKHAIVIAYRTGMRPGEIFALKWSDLNLEQHFISVQRSISRANSKSILKTPKTSSGVRRIDVDSKLTKLFIDLRKEANSDYIFPGKYQEYRVPWNLAEHTRKLCENAGIPPRSFYSLRHTHASVLLAHGVHPKIVQERLGHSDIKITMEVYSHIAPTLQKEAVKVLEAI